MGLWRAANPDRNKAIAAKWRGANRDKIQVWNRERNQADPEGNREKVRAWKEANPAKVAAQKVRYAAKPESQVKLRKNRQRWRKGHLQKEMDLCKLYRERKKVRAAGRERPDICEVCKTSERKIHYDHCHTSGSFRGWLCSHCNHALGHALDSPATLRALADYLERWESINSLI